MVRKTKEDAELTRQRIINAAREVFLAKGVSRTTMEQIAAQAGLTRGAVYWHFNNKMQLFQVMREHVLLPLIDRWDVTSLEESNQDPLSTIETLMCNTIQHLNDNAETSQIYEIMMTKCEYVDDFATVLQQIMDNCSSITESITTIYERARMSGHLNNLLEPNEMAMDTNLFFGGLLHMWVKDTQGTKFRPRAIDLIKAHMKLRRKQHAS